MNHHKNIILLIAIVIFYACSKKNYVSFEEYDFEIKGFTWDPNPYNFSTYINDSVLTKQGLQYASWEYSYIGDIKSMLITWDINAEPRDTLSESEIKSFRAFERRNAKSFILNEASKKEVFIINEAHQMPQHRVFTTDLLQDLYNIGYRHLGLETFLKSKISDSTLSSNKYPVLTNGYYMKEPQFGNMVRQAVKIGFKVFGYESEDHQNAKEREINQAKNIWQYMQDNPEVKYLIHCGFAHGTEGDYGGSWEKTMAGRLNEYTGIDPLTVNQTTYSEKSQKRYENPYYQLTEVNEPSVFIHRDSVFGQYKKGSWCDISVFHPRTKNFNRPRWLLTGNRTIKEIHLQNAEMDCLCLVFTYLKGEEIGRAIPYDVQETKNKKVSLVLEKGSYHLIILNEQGKALITEIEHR